MNPFSGLFHSRKFLVLVLDTIISLALYIVGEFFPDIIKHVEFIILTLQPIFITMIHAIAKEDAALKASGNWKP